VRTRRVFRDYSVLIVDSGENSQLFTQLLAGLGFRRVAEAGGEAPALAAIKKTKPQLVLASKMIGESSGLRILEAARSEKASRLVPFLIVGQEKDLADGELVQKVAAAGLAALVAAPLDEERLGQAVTALLDPLVDQGQEKSFQKADQAAEAIRAGDLKAAAKLLKTALKLYDQSPQTWERMGRLRLKQNQTERAEKAFSRAIKISPHFFKAYFGLAQASEKRGDLKKAGQDLRRALKVAQARKASPAARVRINLSLGALAAKSGELKEAEEYFAQAVEDSPDNPELRVSIGDAYAEAGQHQESEVHYSAALVQDPGLVHVFNRLGMAYRHQKKFDQALELYQRARIHRPEDEHLLFNMARIYLDTGQVDEAQAFLEHALELRPDFKEGATLLKKIRGR